MLTFIIHISEIIVYNLSASTSLEMNERKEEKSVDDKPKHVNNFNNKSRETKNVPVWFLKGKRF